MIINRNPNNKKRKNGAKNKTNTDCNHKSHVIAEHTRARTQLTHHARKHTTYHPNVSQTVRWNSSSVIRPLSVDCPGGDCRRGKICHRHVDV